MAHGWQSPSASLPVCPENVPAGQVVHVATVVCPVGTYASTTGNALLSDCVSCPDGTFSDQTGNTKEEDCGSCPAGTVLEEVAGGGSAAFLCRPCAPGTFKALPGEGTCQACVPGKFAQEVGAVACDKCKGGFFAAGGGASACERCAPGEHAYAGSTACFDLAPFLEGTGCVCGD